ncbi:hypothetical protein HOY82DRAFT_123387 [Tuber indicum]|nr:hypothetical protein HOY82DRAFT_123387 [Tuber indicum]
MDCVDFGGLTYIPGYFVGKMLLLDVGRLSVGFGQMKARYAVLSTTEIPDLESKSNGSHPVILEWVARRKYFYLFTQFRIPVMRCGKKIVHHHTIVRHGGEGRGIYNNIIYMILVYIQFAYYGPRAGAK